VGEAILFGLAASSALVIGGVAGAYLRPPKAVTAVLLAFASGALISALALELFGPAFETGGALPAGLGLPAAVAKALHGWPCSKASGISVSASEASTGS